MNIPSTTHPSQSERCAIYTRSTSAEQATESVDLQEKLCLAAIAWQLGWTVLDEHVHRDLDVSGPTVRGRMGLDSLLANEGKDPRPFECLVFVDASRLGRNSSVVVDILDQLDRLGVYVYFARRQLNAEDSGSRNL